MMILELPHKDEEEDFAVPLGGEAWRSSVSIRNYIN
jgi:hypothetical protein